MNHALNKEREANMDPTIERLEEIRAELIEAGKVNGYSTCQEYSKKISAIDKQIKRVKEG